MIRVVKKDGTKEDFNVQKIVVAVNKSAYRALIKFTQEELDFICKFVEEEVKKMGIQDIQIAQMHNVVEGALEKVNPLVAKNVTAKTTIYNGKRVVAEYYKGLDGARKTFYFDGDKIVGAKLDYSYYVENSVTSFEPLGKPADSTFKFPTGYKEIPLW